jgi:azurin
MKTSTSLMAVLVLAVGFMLPAHAAGKLCKLEIASTDMMQFDKHELNVAADCTEVEVTLKHTVKLPVQAMGHNWALVKTADLAGVVKDGMSAGPAKDYIAPGDKRVLAHTKLIGGGQSVTVKFSTAGLQKGGDYTYVCTFPGHSSLMKGKLTFG